MAIALAVGADNSRRRHHIIFIFAPNCSWTENVALHKIWSELESLFARQVLGFLLPAVQRVHIVNTHRSATSPMSNRAAIGVGTRAD
jgi:hypothetical protein